MMRAKIAALVAAVGAAAASAGAALWAKRKADEDDALERELLQTLEVEAGAESDTEPDVADIPIEPGPVAGAPGSGGEKDDLTALKGIGAVSAERLAEAGVTTLAQLADWSDEDIDDYGERIRISPERIRREDWVGQARALVER